MTISEMTVERTGPVGVPAVSVCIPLYNKERFIAATIAGVLAQTFTDFELVILENASTDGSADIVRTYDDPRIVLARNSSTIPAQQNYHRAVELSRAPLVKLLNADDGIEPTALARQVETLLGDPSLSMVTSRQSIVDEHGEVLVRGHSLRTADLIGRQERSTVVRRMVRHGGNPIGNPGNVLFRRSAYDAAGGVGAATFVADVALWVELVRYGAYFGIPEDLAVFRCAPASYSTSAKARNVLIQRRFIRDVMRSNRDVVRWRDRMLSALRFPVTIVGSYVFFGASASTDTMLYRVAARIMSLRNRPAGNSV